MSKQGTVLAQIDGTWRVITDPKQIQRVEEIGKRVKPPTLYMLPPRRDRP